MNLGKAVPLCLPDNHTWDAEKQCIHINEGAPRNKLQLCEEGLNILKRIDNSVVVVCITGPVRSGKSFLLSQIQNGGRFDVHHGTTSKTTGIWIASPKRTVMRNGHPARLIFLDTEGLGSLNTSDGNEDNTWERKLLALSLLLSSYFIFNSQGTPSYDDLSKLGFLASFSEFVKKAKMPQRRGRHTTHQSNTSLPDFLWLVRDVIVKPELDNKPCSWSTYLRAEVLQTRGGRSRDTRDNIRRAVIDTFGKIDAESMPFPSIDPDVIQTLDSPKVVSKLHPQFKKAMQDITDKIISYAKVKREAGRVLMGRDLADLLQGYVKVLNSPNGIIDVESAWDCLTAVKDAQKLYTNEMKAIDMPCENDQVVACHLLATGKASALISSKADRSSASDIEFYKEKFNAGMQEKLQQWQMKNSERSRSFCQTIKDKMREKYLRQTNITDVYCIDDVNTAKEKALEEYMNSARGPVKMIVFKELQSLAIDFNVCAIKMLTESYLTKAVNLYKEEMSKITMPCPSHNLDEMHSSASLVAERFFSGKVPSGNNNVVSGQLERLSAAIASEKSAITKDNSNLSRESCENLYRFLREKHLKRIIDDLGISSNLQDLKDGFKLVLNYYDKNAIGPEMIYVRKKALEEMETLIQENQSRLLQRGLKKAEECYSQLLNNLMLPCLERDLYRHESRCRPLADKTFWRYCTGISQELCENELLALNWTLKGIFETRRVENNEISRRNHVQRIRYLEREYGLDEILQSPFKRNEEKVRSIHSAILSNFKETATGEGADEFYGKTKDRYNDTLQQCSKEHAESVAALAAGGALLLGLAVFGITKAFGSSNSKRE